MNSSNKINIKVVWYLISLLVVSFVISVVVLNKHTTNVFEEYPSVKSVDAVDEVISVKDVYKSTTLIKTVSEKKISVSAYNWHIKPSALYYHLEKGDSISRKPYSDTLYL